MNAQDYISSGLLEAYVLGGLELTESEQVAGAMCRFPDVAAEVSRIEADLMRAAEQDAVEPPPGLDNRIWAAIQAESKAALDSSNHSVSGADVADHAIKAPKHTTKIIPLDSRTQSRSMPWARAAVLVVLIGSLAGNLIFWNGRSADKEQLASVQARMGALSEQQQKLTASVLRYQHESEMAARTDMQPVMMTSTQPGHAMAATIYWNKAQGEAYVSVHKLPPPPAGMQYQLWAIADGKPVDIGMLDNDVAMNGGMQKVPKSVIAGQAFAVSLEKSGGNPVPTADKIYLLGKMPSA